MVMACFFPHAHFQGENLSAEDVAWNAALEAMSYGRLRSAWQSTEEALNGLRRLLALEAHRIPVCKYEADPVPIVKSSPLRMQNSDDSRSPPLASSPGSSADKGSELTSSQSTIATPDRLAVLASRFSAQKVRRNGDERQRFSYGSRTPVKESNGLGVTSNVAVMSVVLKKTIRHKRTSIIVRNTTMTTVWTLQKRTTMVSTHCCEAYFTITSTMAPDRESLGFGIAQEPPLYLPCTPPAACSAQPQRARGCLLGARTHRSKQRHSHRAAALRARGPLREPFGVDSTALVTPHMVSQWFCGLRLH